MVWRLERVLPQVPSTDSESSWEDRWCFSPLPPGHLQHPSHPQSPLHCRWSHPPDTQLLQSATIREETAESPSQDQQTERQLHPPGCQEAELPPVLAPPPPLSYPTHHWTLHYTIYILHCLFVCLFISLVCSIYHVPYATLSIFYIIIIISFFIFIFTCSYLYICNSCIFVYVYIYIYLICTYLYFCVLLLVFSV